MEQLVAALQTLCARARMDFAVRTFLGALRADHANLLKAAWIAMKESHNTTALSKDMEIHSSVSALNTDAGAPSEYFWRAKDSGQRVTRICTSPIARYS